MSELRFVGDLQRCDVRPGDRFVLTTDQHLSADATRSVQQAWREFIGGDQPLFIIPPGWKLGVLGDVEPVREGEGE